jgi:choline-sulfatase
MRIRSVREAYRCALVFLLLVILPSSWLLSAEPARPSVVMVVVDALRPDHLGCYGYDLPTSPRIDELAAGAVVFDNAIAQAPWTKGSLATVFTSLYSFQHGVTNWDGVLPDRCVTLGEILRDGGYATIAVINMVGLAGRFGVVQGFDDISVALKHRRGAAATTDQVIDLMKQRAAPYFIVIHYFDVHVPYRPPLEYLDMMNAIREHGSAGAEPSASEMPSRPKPADKILKYDSCVRYVDGEIGRLIDYLVDAGLRRETILIVTADHGEAFAEHGVYGHGAEAYDEAIRVPLIISYPARYTDPLRIEAQVRHVDLMPTILDLTGLEDDEHREGTSLAPLMDGAVRQSGARSIFPLDVAFCDCTARTIPGKMALRSLGWKIIVEPVTSLVELYDLKEDPGETTNLWGVGLPAEASLLEILKRVPSVSLRGWRLAMLGGRSGSTYRAEVRVAGRGRFSQIGSIAGLEKNLSVDVTEDSTSMNILDKVRGMHIVYFDTEPHDAAIEVTITRTSGSGPTVVHVGPSGQKQLGEKLSLRPQDASGLAAAFEDKHFSGESEVYMWWLPGRALEVAREKRSLTPEEKRRLKALGYIQ